MNKIKYTPLIFVEIYLILTIFLLFAGPIFFNIQNASIFIILILLYHLAFIFGYILGVEKKLTKPNKNLFKTKYFYALLLLGSISSLITYSNLMLADSLLPENFIYNIKRGITEPGLVYTERMLIIQSGYTTGSRLVNIFSIFISFSMFLFIFYSIFYWKSINLIKKIIFFMFCLLFIAPGISSGVNSLTFFLFIFASVSFITVFFIRNNRMPWRLIIFIGIIFLIPFSFFGQIMSERGGGFEFFSSTSPLGHIYYRWGINNIEENEIINSLYFSFVWMVYYLVQGYYGFSLIIGLDHNWTLFFGSSDFLQRQGYLLTGIDISSATFQRQITHYWDQSSQWHSAYSFFANDFSVIGVVLVMFILGFIFGRSWFCAYYEKNFYSAALIPILVIMIIFIPANNIVFNSIFMLSYFLFVILAGIFSKRSN